MDIELLKRQLSQENSNLAFSPTTLDDNAGVVKETVDPPL